MPVPSFSPTTTKRKTNMKEAMRIKGVIHGVCGKRGCEHKLGLAAFMLRNTHPSNTIYFRDKGRDGISAGAANAASLPAGEGMHFPLRADVLSLAGSESGTTYELLMLE